jgi:hypothetical protein
VLALSADHEREFPRGAFVEERQAARAVARCSSRETNAAERESVALAFTSQFPRSPQRARVEDACTPGASLGR